MNSQRRSQQSGKIQGSTLFSITKFFPLRFLDSTFLAKLTVLICFSDFLGHGQHKTSFKLLKLWRSTVKKEKYLSKGKTRWERNFLKNGFLRFWWWKLGGEKMAEFGFCRRSERKKRCTRRRSTYQIAARFTRYCKVNWISFLVVFGLESKSRDLVTIYTLYWKLQIIEFL